MAEEIVVPGDFLSVEEEFGAGKNTFEDNEGNIFASVVGEKNFNNQNREVSIKTHKTISQVELGSIVTGKIVRIKDPVVTIEVSKIEKDGKEQVSSFGVVQLMIANVSMDRIRFLRDEFRAGDIIKAKVIRINKFGIDVATKYPEFGVIKAFCSQCRHSLELYERTLKCPKCGSVEKRKLSSDFR